MKWRAALACSAKTVKEYQVSACAFLNWLMRTDRLAVNPLGKVDKIDVRGKQVRASRTYTEPERRSMPWYAVPLKAELGSLCGLRPADCSATDRALEGHLQSTIFSEST